MSVEFVTFDEYKQNGLHTNKTHWSLAPGSTYQERWPYHAEAIELLKGLNIEAPSDVLEIGTYGASLVKGSDTLDIESSKPRCQGDYRLTITHDLRILPWPISKKYKALVALRVWHHLMPVQREAFNEAKRISENIIIVCPEETYHHRIGVTRQQFAEWNGREPDYIADVFGAENDAMGPIYLFKER
jgi:hypothetical protein